MANEFEGKSLEELKELFEETVANYNPVPEEEVAEYDSAKAAYKAAEDQLYSILATLGTDRIKFNRNRIEILYKKEEEDWETDEIKLVDAKTTESFEFIRKVICKDFLILELREAFDKDLSLVIGRHVGNHYYCKSLSEIESLVSQATSITGKIDYHFVAALKPFTKALNDSSRKMYDMELEWERRRSAPENILSAIRSKWFKENPVESFLGKDVRVEGFYGLQHIERFTDQFAVLSGGYRTKKENILLWKMLENLDWYKELYQKKSNLPYVYLPR